MSELIIITGVAGSGKTTLSKQIQQNYPDFRLLSFDTIKEEVWDDWGFNNQKEKDLLREVAKHLYQANILLNVCKGQNIILEYPFKAEWSTFFYDLKKNYLCNIIYIGCGMDLRWEELLLRKRHRDATDKSRHLGHKCSTYHKDGKCIEYTKAEIDKQERVLNREFIKEECFSFRNYVPMINSSSIKDGLLWGN